MKQICMKIDLSQGRENVLFLLSNMAAMTSHENALLLLCDECIIGLLGTFFLVVRFVLYFRGILNVYVYSIPQSSRPTLL